MGEDRRDPPAGNHRWSADIPAGAEDHVRPECPQFPKRLRNPDRYPEEIGDILRIPIAAHFARLHPGEPATRSCRRLLFDLSAADPEILSDNPTRLQNLDHRDR